MQLRRQTATKDTKVLYVIDFCRLMASNANQWVGIAIGVSVCLSSVTFMHCSLIRKLWHIDWRQKTLHKTWENTKHGPSLGPKPCHWTVKRICTHNNRSNCLQVCQTKQYKTITCSSGNEHHKISNAFHTAYSHHHQLIVQFCSGKVIPKSKSSSFWYNFWLMCFYKN